MKDNFSSDEWEVMVSSPFWVFNIVASADGVIDKKEVKAFKRVLQNFSEFGNPLTKEVLSAAGGSFDEDSALEKGDFDENLRKVAKILDSKTDLSDSLIFKKTLIAIGIHVGNSSGAIFSSKFSDEEVDALKEVGTLLGVNQAQLSQSPSIKDIIKSIKN